MVDKIRNIIISAEENHLTYNIQLVSNQKHDYYFNGFTNNIAWFVMTENYNNTKKHLMCGVTMYIIFVK